MFSSILPPFVRLSLPWVHTPPAGFPVEPGDLPDMPDFLRELGGQEEKKLPESISSLLDNPNKTKCRINWKSLITGFESHGDWFDLTDEPMLQREINAMNVKYARELSHWLEYK